MNNWKDTLNMLRPFYRGLPIIAVIMIVAVLTMSKYLNYVTPMYESVSKIKLADVKEGAASATMYKDFDVFATTNKIGAEVEVVKSPVVIKKALSNLNIQTTIFRIGDFRNTELYDQSPLRIMTDIKDQKLFDKAFAVTVKNNSILDITTPNAEKIEGKINEVIHAKGVDILIVFNDSLISRKPGLLINDNYQFIVHSENKLIDEIRETIDVMAADKEVPIIRIAYTSAVPQKSADIVNQISEAYINDYISEKYKTADTTVDFLNKELHNYNTKLASSENEIEDYKHKEGIVDIPQEIDATLKKVGDLKKQLANVKMSLASIDSLNNYVQRGKDNFLDLAPNFEAYNDLLSTEIVKKMKTLQSEKRDLLLKYTPENEKVQVVDQKLKDMDDYLLEGIKNSKADLQIKYDELDLAIKNAESAFASMPSKQKNMVILDRNFGLNEDIYKFLHEKRTDAEITRAANISFHRILAAGEVPTTPVSPNVTLLKAVAGFLGFLGGIFLIYLVHFIKGRVNDLNSIQRSSDTPVLAAIPFLSKEKGRELFFDKTAIEIEIKKWLSPGSVIVCSSFDKNEGKRFVAVSLAKSIENLGKKVLLVDVDSTIGEAIPNEVNMVSLPASGLKWKQPDVWKNLVSKWKEDNEVIVIKNAPLKKESSSMLAMASGTLNLFLLDSRNTRKSRIEEADLLKEDLQIPNMQFLLNRSGYTPTLFTQAFDITKRIFKKK
ncbi:MAG TPA: GNVR domain-containing protein [Panacibacter sp.]|nr:GNVR domain-containing protein [Panacibacter sp.]HNP45777.1 GNVR domain-containing protein [Panacibacter sp.]